MFGWRACRRSAARVAQGVVRPSRAAAAAMASPTSPPVPGWRGAGNSPRHVDEQAPTRSAAGRRGRGRAVLERWRHLAALRSDARHQEGESGRDRPDLGELDRRGRTDDESDGPAGPPLDGPTRDSGVQRLLRRCGRTVIACRCRHDERLELGCPRVRRPAQDVGEPIESLEQRCDGLARRDRG